MRHRMVSAAPRPRASGQVAYVLRRVGTLFGVKPDKLDKFNPDAESLRVITRRPRAPPTSGRASADDPPSPQLSRRAPPAREEGRDHESPCQPQAAAGAYAVGDHGLQP